MSTNNHWSIKNMPDQSGKIAIITGANSGIGYEAAKALVLKGTTVIMACRSLDKGKGAVEIIHAEDPQADVRLMQLDLADLSSVKQFAEVFLSEYTRLDLLINNAGVMAIPFRQTVDGFEMQFGTNHLGHFALTGLLFDLLKNTPNSRVITVSSNAHLLGNINFDDLNSERSYQKWLAYGQSKLANLLFAYELQRRSARNEQNPISIVVHPGYAATNLQHTTTFFRLLNPIMAQSQEMGTLPTLFAATNPEIRGGEYVGPDGFLGQRGYPKVTRSSKRSYNEATARRLWEASEVLTRVKFNL